MLHDQAAEHGPAHLEARLHRMLANGRITPEEAARVRHASDVEERRAALAAIQLRHASERLAQAVEEERLTRAEADDALQRLADSGDPADVRRLLGGRGHRDGDSIP